MELFRESSSISLDRLPFGLHVNLHPRLMSLIGGGMSLERGGSRLRVRLRGRGSVHRELAKLNLCYNIEGNEPEYGP